MVHEHDIPELDRKGLRAFGLTTGAIVAVLFGLFFPWLLARPIPYWPWAIAGILGVWGLAAPTTLRPVYRVWMRFGLLLSKVTTPLILGLVFFLVILPMGWLKRIFGQDAMRRRFDAGAASYRIVSKASPAENLKRPF